MVILAHHEIVITIIQYLLAISVGGFLCFRFFFPMIGRGIVNLNLKMQNRVAKLKADEDKWKKDVRKQIEEERFELERQKFEKEYRGYFETESQIAKVLKKQEAQKLIQRRADDQCVIDGLYMNQDEIEKAYRGNEKRSKSKKCFDS